MIRFDKKKYHTVEEFMFMCGFPNRQRVYRAIHADKIKGVIQVGNQYLIPVGAVILDEPDDITAPTNKIEKKEKINWKAVKK